MMCREKGKKIIVFWWRICGYFLRFGWKNNWLFGFFITAAGGRRRES